MGPDTYDLASLLRDSYVDIADELIDALVERFLALSNRRDERDAFRVRFDLMSLQRNLKALGTFGYQTTANENPVYIQYLPRTLSHVRENLHKYPRFGRLAGLLSRHLPELA
jgi:aminoglycoside/choline kinase family phosphotransferase